MKLKRKMADLCRKWFGPSTVEQDVRADLKTERLIANVSATYVIAQVHAEREQWADWKSQAAEEFERGKTEGRRIATTSDYNLRQSYQRAKEERDGYIDIVKLLQEKLREATGSTS